MHKMVHRKYARCLILFWVALGCSLRGKGETPDDVMRAAGFDVDNATSATPQWKMKYSINQPVYQIIYEFPGETMFLEVDTETSESIEISGQPGRGPNPTSDTITLTPEWARATLLSLNPYKIARGLIRMGEPTISYDAHSAKYEVLFPRLDASGNEFESAAAFFDFDHATSSVTFLDLGVYAEEPEVTTGTLISQAQATSIALQWLMDRRSSMFKFVPEKMTWDYVPESNEVRVVERNVGPSTGTVVAWKIRHFKSRMTDPTYTGPYHISTILLCVDAFNGDIVAGDVSRMYITGQ